MSKLEYEFDEKSNQIISPLNNKRLTYTPEEEIRQKFICVLVNEYGYSLNQMAQELSLTNSSRGTGRARADIVIWKSEEAKKNNEHAAIVIECKSDNVTIQPEDYYQGLNYATWAGADFFVTHNSKETRYFQVFKDKLPKHLGKELSELPTAKQLVDSKVIEEMLKAEKVFEKDEFAKLLHQCHSIIRNNDKLSPEAAFDEISKILFMKIMYERNTQKGKIFTKEEFLEQESHYEKNIRPVNVRRNGPKDDIPYVTYWFDDTKNAYKAEQLFEDNEVIKIRRESFLAILEKLQIYNLSKTSDDVKGVAFEKFLGLRYKALLAGMNFMIVEESYTSKTSFLDRETLYGYKGNRAPQKYKFVGNRITRSLFKSKDGFIIHADTNASFNIIRKVSGDSIYNFVEMASIRGSSPKRWKINLA